MFEKKQLDWMGSPFTPLSIELITRIKNEGALSSHPMARAFWVFLNTQQTSLSSPAIRKALSLAIDRKAITEHILLGNHPLDKPLPYALLPGPPPSTIKLDLEEAKKII
jgi:ABC-type oligopeptide transport system substrate-binding subunit